IVDKVLGGQGLPGTTVIPPLYPQWHLEPGSQYGYDPVKAGQLLDAAGFPIGDDGVRADAQGNRLSFRLLYRTESEDSTSQKSAEFVQAYFKDIGVEVTLKGVTEDSLYEIVGQGNFDMFEWSWGVEPDPNYMLSTFTCANRSYEDGGSIYANLSDSFYCNPEYDKLFEQQAAETDFAARQATVQFMQQMLYGDAPYIITYYANGLEAYRNDRFTGWVKQPKDTGTLIFQWGTWSYLDVEPVTAATAAESASPTQGVSAAPSAAAGDTTAQVQPAASSGGISAGLIIGLLVAVLVIVVLIVVLLRMRRTVTNEDRE
ncbi:MAG: ABC transporter substrate-binding protein, partial [Actinomycetes bacterium]